MVHKNEIKKIGWDLSLNIDGLHWVFTDLRYGYITDKMINELKNSREFLDKKIKILEELKSD